MRSNAVNQWYLIISLLSLISLTAAYLYAFHTPLWNPDALQVNYQTGDGCFSCQLQIENLTKKKNKLKEEKAFYTKSLRQLDSALMSRGRDFLDSSLSEKKWLEKIIRRTEKKLIDLAYTPAKELILIDFAKFFAILVSSFIIVFQIRSGYQRIPVYHIPDKLYSLRERGWIILLISCGFHFSHTLRYYLSSVLDTDKTWFTWISYCLSENHAGTYLMFVHYAFQSVLLAIPLFTLLEISHRKYVPEVALRSNRSYYAIALYLDYTEKWFYFMIITVSLCSSLFFYEAFLGSTGSLAYYAVEYVLVFAILIFLIFRHARNIYSIRRDYYLKKMKAGRLYTKLSSRNFDTDPTERYIGKTLTEFLFKTIVPAVTSLITLAFALGISKLFTSQ